MVGVSTVSNAQRIMQLRTQIAEQRRWMESCGATLAGYVRNYKSKDDPEHYGEGGEAIFAADNGFLQRLLAEYERLNGGILRCPNCRGTDLTFDWDAVITVNVKDGQLDHVTIGGVFGVLPDKLMCADCDEYADPSDMPADFARKATHDIDAQVSERDPDLSRHLNDGWDVLKGTQ